MQVGDVAAMAQRSLELLEPTRWGQVREAAIRHTEQFHEAKIVPMYEALYERVLST